MTDTTQPPTMVSVNAAALREILIAVTGPAHHIRELQVTRGLPMVDNPIDILINDYNAAVEANKAKA